MSIQQQHETAMTMFRRKRFSAAWLAASAFVFVCAQERLAAQCASPIEFSRKLNEEKMFDYSEMALKKAAAENPKEKEKYMAQLADTYIQSGKSAEARRVIASIPQNSPYYKEGQFVLGKAALLAGKTDSGIVSLKKYLDSFEGKVPEDSDIRQNYRAAVMCLNWAYQEKGDFRSAEAAVKYLEAAQKDKRETQLCALILKLDSAEKLKADNNNSWKAMAETALPALAELQWGGQDLITLTAFIQRARAFWMLGKYQESLKELACDPELFAAFDEALAKEKRLAECPGALALFWEGRNYLSLGEKGSDSAVKEEYFARAMKKYLRAVIKYPGFPKEAAAYSDMALAKASLEKLGKTVALPPNLKLPEKAQAAAEHTTGEADSLISKGKYAEAIPKLFELRAANKDSKTGSEILQKLALCFAGNKNDLEAIAVIKFLAAKHGSDPDVPLAMIQTGQTLGKNKLSGAEESVYNIYLSCYPSHQYAYDIAGLIANEYYKKALDAAKEAEAASGAAKKEKIARAETAFKIAAAHIKRVLTDFSSSPGAAKPAYELLAAAYSSAGMKYEAGKIYSEYCGMLKGNPQKMAAMKLCAADSFFSAGQDAEDKARNIREQGMSLPPQTGRKAEKPAEAEKALRTAKDSYAESIKNLDELLNVWLAKGGAAAQASDPKTLKTAENALLLLALACDAAGEKKKAADIFTSYTGKYPKSEKIPACMARLGAIYYQMSDTEASARALEELAAKYPESEEAKNAFFNLGKNLYESKSYDKAFVVFSKIFQNNISVPVLSLRWMASELQLAPESYSAEGAKLALKASAELMEKFGKTELQEWIGKEQAAALLNNPEEKQKTFELLKQKTWLDAGAAACRAGDPQAARGYLDKVLENKRSPYFFTAMFVRADACAEAGDIEKARSVWSDISLFAGSARKEAAASRAKCLLADSYMKDGNYTKAAAVLRPLAKQLETAETSSETSKTERGAEREWLERAVYKAFVCASKTGNSAECKTLADLYKKNFPNGVYIKEISQ